MNTLLIVVVVAGLLSSGYTLGSGRTDGTIVADNDSYGDGNKEEVARDANGN